MKKTIILLSLTFTTLIANATVITVSNNANSPGQYTDLATAITAAASGDTLYVHGSPTDYGDVTITKPLTIIGAGALPNKNYSFSTIINSITLGINGTLSSASGSKIYGCSLDWGITLNAGNGTTVPGISNVTIERNDISAINFQQGGTNTTLAHTNVNISNNVIYVIYGNSCVKNSVIRNNIIILGLTSMGHEAVGTWTCKNNILMGNLSASRNGVVSNNIFYTTPNNSAFYNNNNFCSVSNNCFMGTTHLYVPSDIIYGTNTGGSNLLNVDPMFVYYNPADIGVNAYIQTTAGPYADFNLLGASPAHNYGTDGTDIGIYGGSAGFVEGYPANSRYRYYPMPAIPTMLDMQINNTTIGQAGTLNVQFEAAKINQIQLLTGGEWFVDSDPGIGNGASLSFSPTDTINTIVNLTTTSLPVGTHYLFIRVKNTSVNWSLYEGRPFTVQACTLNITASAGTIAICQGSSTTITTTGGGVSFQWYNGVTLLSDTLSSQIANSTGTYKVVATDAIGCKDTSNVVSITVNPTYTNNASASICQGDTFTFPDATTATSATVHTSHLSSIYSCDSSIVTTLTVNPTYTSNASASICQGDTYTFPDATTATSATVHTSHLSSIYSCDSSIVTTLTVNPTYTNNASASICQGDTYTFPDLTTATSATLHTSHFSTANSCDSSIVTTLTVNPTYTSNVSDSICFGDTYTFPDGTTATTATIHTSHFNTIDGCDSSIVTTLTINCTVGINKITNDNSFSIYPNPANGQFTILLPTDNAEIIVTNTLGQQILKTQATQNTTNLQLDNNGVYIIYVKTKQETVTRKLIVNR